MGDDVEPLYGQRLLCEIIDERAETEPDTVWATLIESPDLKELREITYDALANAINRVSWWLDSFLGKIRQPKVLYYDGPPDIRFVLFAVAAMKIGHKALFISPRNTNSARLDLLDSTECEYAFGSKTPQMDQILETKILEFHEFPTLEDCLEENKERTYQFSRAFEVVADEAFLILHTSGSTNNPKPIEVTHRLVSVIDAYHRLPEIDGRNCMKDQFEEGLRIFMALPPFHSAGINFFAYSVFYRLSLVYPPSQAPPSCQLLDSVLDAEIADAAYMPPSLLEGVSDCKPALDKISSWRYVGYGGGPLSKRAGDLISEKTQIYNCLGSTETFHLPEFPILDHKDWDYHHFHPSLGIEFQVHHDGLHEMVFKRDDENQSFQSAFVTFPEDSEYRMKDLYAQHPENENLWLFKGRNDDMILLSSGEKLQPNEVEDMLKERSDIKSALLVGENRFQPALLLEPASEDTKSLQEVVPSIVEDANKMLPGHGQIDVNHVRILDPSKSLPRSSKGAIQRKKASEELAEVIEDIYQNEENAINDSSLNFDSLETLQKSILEAVTSFCAQLHDAELDDDFFATGMDSLQAMQLTRMFRKNVTEAGFDGKSVQNNLLYQYPTLAKLSRALFKLSGKGDQSDDEDPHVEIQNTIDEMRSDLPRAKFCVILTGSTGSLGSYILDRLMRSSKISTIFCLNRSEDGAERQKECNERRGLSVDFDAKKVEFLQADLTEEHLGLAEDLHQRLLSQATHLVHVAWPVNFNHAFNHFKPQVLACRHLIDFSASSSHRAEIIFMSSIGAANNWGENHSGVVPEEPIADLSSAESTGYSQSKLASELLFDTASSLSGVPSTVCRIGQISGPVLKEDGEWNKQEWLPSLIASSAHLQKLPESISGLETVDWVPVDVLAKCIVELLRTKPSRCYCRILNMVNPNTTTWAELLPTVQEMLPGNPEVVPLEEWIEALKGSADAEVDESSDKNPGVRLLDFYEKLQTLQRPEFDTRKAARASKTLASLPKVSQEWMTKWMKQWAFA